MLAVSLAVAAAAGIAHAAAGHVGFLQSQTDGSDADGLDGALQVAVSPDGRSVYVTAFDDNALGVFARDPKTGALSFVEKEPAGGNLLMAEGVTVAPDGLNVYATGFLSDTVVALRRDPRTGMLDLVDTERDAVNGVDGLDEADSVAVAADGRHVYVTGLLDDSLAAFSRDPRDGVLEFVATLRDGEEGVDGLDAPETVRLSPDGRNVYVAADGDDSLAAFSRDPETGRLGFVEAEKDGTGGVDGLGNAFGVAIAPDGRHVYTSSWGDDAVSAFSRDPASGAVTFVETDKDDTNGVMGLADSYAVAVSPEGRNVYATGDADLSIVSFARDPRSGTLSQLDRDRVGEGNLDGAPDYGLAIPLDARNLYATASSENKLLVFSREIVATCRGQRPTLWGTDFGDEVTGTAGADVISTLAGADRALGLAGSDLVCGASARDRLKGGRGSDRLLGQAGSDTLRGGSGADRLRGGRGRDRLLGGTGGDRLRGEGGPDRLLGGTGPDRLLGGPGDDSERQ
jgi:6-phosphogluconolactonase (cycloisomerase 2 family)